MAVNTPKPFTLEPPPDIKRSRWLSRLGFAAVIAVMAWSYRDTGISVQGLFTGLGDAWGYIFGTAERPNSGYFPPDFSRFDRYFSEMVLTIKMAVWGTVLSIPLSIVLGFLGANNVQSNPVIYQGARRLMDFLRSLNELIIALVFVAAVGLGPFAGVMALAIGGIGSLGKLISEAIESLDMGQVEAVRATGANPVQITTHGFWPQVLPLFVSYSLYRFELNVRAATILGIVGAGGIGFYLQESMRTFDNNSTATILIIIMVSVFVIDSASSQIRKRVV